MAGIGLEKLVEFGHFSAAHVVGASAVGEWNGRYVTAVDLRHFRRGHEPLEQVHGVCLGAAVQIFEVECSVEACDGHSQHALLVARSEWLSLRHGSHIVGIPGVRHYFVLVAARFHYGPAREQAVVAESVTVGSMSVECDGEVATVNLAHVLEPVCFGDVLVGHNFGQQASAVVGVAGDSYTLLTHFNACYV